MRRTPFRRKEPTYSKEPHPLMELEGDAALSAAAFPRIQSLRKSTYSGTTTGAVPKTEAKRCPALLEMARDRQCLLRIPGVCAGDTATTVAAHSNEMAHGKAKGRKADDVFSAWCCVACHRWLDAGPAPKEVKQARFALAHLDQVIEWRRVASDMGEPVRFRRAAEWALRELAATPAV